jgi:uncharacterized protein YcfL
MTKKDTPLEYLYKLLWYDQKGHTGIYKYKIFYKRVLIKHSDLNPSKRMRTILLNWLNDIKN